MCGDVDTLKDQCDKALEAAEPMLVDRIVPQTANCEQGDAMTVARIRIISGGLASAVPASREGGGLAWAIQ